MKTIPKLESAGDAELVELCLGENRNAFASIIARYQSLICAITYNACGDIGRSEDLAQDTFVTAWKRLRELKEPAKLKSWLCGIARNLSNNSMRRDVRTPTALSDPLLPEDHSGGANPREQAVSKEEEALVWKALEAIPADYREPMILFYREGQSAQAVATALDLSEEAVWQRLSRGRVMLKAGVTKTVESTLGRSVPGKAFTGAVLAALTVLPTSAKAATVGAATAKGSVSAKMAVALGTAPGWFGIAFYYSLLKALIEDTKSPRERQFMVRFLWLRSAAVVVMILLLIGIQSLNKNSYAFLRDPFAREVAVAVALLGMAAYSAITIEMTNRWRRQIQIEDGTFVKAEWEMQEKPRSLRTDVFGNNTKAFFYRKMAFGLVMAMVVVMAFKAAWIGRWGIALLWIFLLGLSAFRNIRALRWRPRFDPGFRVVSSSVRLCGLVTLLFCNLHHFHGLAVISLWNMPEILLNAAVVLVYAAFMGLLAWLHRRDPSSQP